MTLGRMNPSRDALYLKAIIVLCRNQSAGVLGALPEVTLTHALWWKQ